MMPIEGHLAGPHLPFFSALEERQTAVAQNMLLASVGNANKPAMR
jgi:hypothetical protein